MLISWGSIVRLLRRRVVLGIIFGLSFTYCAISLLAHENIGATLSSYTNDADENLIIDSEDLVQDEDLDEDISEKIFADVEDGNLDPINPQALDNSNSTDTPRTCRNSIQGKVLIVDERGFVCARKEVLPTGCCRLEVQKKNLNDETNIFSRERYSCETCNPQSCCAVYEYCVSCCLHPGKRRPKKDTHGSAVRREVQGKLRKPEDMIKYRFRNLDRFQICLAACRTSSASVRHENTYKDPHSKHCYTSINSFSANSHPRSLRDLANNNNGDNVAITSSTVRLLILDCSNPLSFKKTYSELYLIIVPYYSYYNRISRYVFFLSIILRK